MFGKNYDKELEMVWKELAEQKKEMVELYTHINKLTDGQNMILNDLIDIAKVQATHKKSIAFLLRNTEVDSDGKIELIQLLKNISEINKTVKNG